VVVTASALAQQNPLHIVFLAGPRDHGMQGRHEYEKDLRVLSEAFAAAANAMA